MDEKYEIDYEALAKEIKNQAVLSFVGTLMGDSQETKDLIGMLKIFIRHGIAAENALDIILDINKYLAENNTNEEKE